MTETRLRLLANGWSPIRNRDKRTFLKGWPTVELTEETIRSWSRMTRDAATGGRIENGLAAIDVDTSDAIMVEVLADVLMHVAPELSEERVPWLERNSGRAKVAWFFRTAEPFGRLHTRRWLRPGETAEDDTHFVEVFGGASPRQFGLFGPHTVADNGEVLRTYGWRDRSPLDTRVDELPVLSKAQFHAFVDKAEEMFADAGWTPVPRSEHGEDAGGRVYDLTEEMTFDCDDGLRRPLEALREALQAGDELRCSASWLEGENAKRTDRCICGLTRSGHVSVWESASAVTHVEAAAAPTDHGELIRRAQEKLKELHERRRHKVQPDDDAWTAAGKLLAAYAYCPSQTAAPVVPLWTDNVDAGMPLRVFRELTFPNHSVQVGPRGGERKITPADLWLGDKQRVTVEGVRLRPDMPRPTFREDGKLWVNAYNPPVYDTEREEAGGAAWDAFVRHLLPDEAEREWFLDWLAHKLENPAVPGSGVIMVAKRQGAGRGTLFAIVRQLFGPAYVRKVDGLSLTGDGAQAQYNTWLANSLVLLVDELFSAGSGMHLWQRKKAYDRLKSLIDPAARDVEIVRKTLNNYVTRTFATFLMATNNANALPLEKDDRRVAVLTNGGRLADAPGVAAALDAWRDGAGFDERFVCAVARSLARRDLSRFDAFAAAPMFRGKSDMIEHNATDGSEAAEEALRTLPGDFVTRNAFVDRVCHLAGAGSRQDKHTVAEARAVLEGSDWVFLGRVKVAENGSKAQVWARDEAAAQRWAGTVLAGRKALLEPNENVSAKATAAQLARLEGRLRVVRDGDAETGVSD